MNRMQSIIKNSGLFHKVCKLKTGDDITGFLKEIQKRGIEKNARRCT